ncbi:MAG: 5-amino-6-(D-ribitylamino)uracil--L-tyrosine 4-hydroxyphenyl transferase CofH, partial [Verrucomicrobiia bacterium]
QRVGDELRLEADELVRRRHGRRVSYVVNRNVNFTNICNVGCTFCGFQRRRGAPDGYTRTVEEVVERLEESPGIREVCLQGGINPELGFEYYEGLVSAIRERFPRLHLHGFSPMEIEFLHRRTGWSYEKVLGRLKEAGLNTIPGTAAEILVDEVRAEISGNKLSAGVWERIVRTAHGCGLKSTATVMFGHVETREHLAQHFERLKGIQEETGGFTEMIPLAFVPYRNRLGRRVVAAAGGRERFEAGLVEKARWLYPLVRVYFDRLIPNVQTSWVKLGPALAAESLGWGCNDFGGTLMEESITRESGGIHGEALTREEIRGWILSAGKEPVERDTMYEVVEAGAVVGAAS